MKIRSLAAISLLALAQASAAAPPDVRVVFVRDGVFTSPADDAWAAIPETTQQLQEQLIFPPVGGGSVSEVAVRAVHDGEEIAIRLEWSDSTADRGVGVDTFRDAAAIGFPVGRPETVPSPFMGDEQHPVVIWQWAADFDANAEGRSRFGERYPHSEGVWIFPQDLSVRRKVRGWRGAEPVIEYVARGFGTLTPREGAAAAGMSEHSNGQWSVVFRRKLTTSIPEDASFVAGETTPFILAIWDGANQEVNGRKAVTLTWIPAKLDDTISTTTTSSVGLPRAEK
jgi:dimethylsulfide dehydrogenase subunit gamma/complex iron-sulfur molybdoenzyme family reductase subunit gamma